MQYSEGLLLLIICSNWLISFILLLFSDGVAITSNISGEVAACAKLSGLTYLN